MKRSPAIYGDLVFGIVVAVLTQTHACFFIPSICLSSRVYLSLCMHVFMSIYLSLFVSL